MITHMTFKEHDALRKDIATRSGTDPADLTRVFVYLASDESRSITGKRFLAQSDNVIEQAKRR